MRLLIGPQVINSYKRLAYTPWHALAEFVDNSTQSYFNDMRVLDKAFATTSEKLTVIFDYDGTAGYLRVHDNAMGMSLEELERAMNVGLPPEKTTGRSKYGMGLKTAASWLGDRWVVTTKRIGATVEHSVTIDVNVVAAGTDTLPMKTRENLPKETHYTNIEIRKLNRKFPGRTLGKIKDFLRSMYREDFRNGVLNLYWGAEQLIWVDDPDRFLKTQDGGQYKKDFQFRVGSKPVSGWVGILARGSREDAGFTILHRGRMVRGYPDSWRPESLFGQYQGSNDLVNQRLIGEIHLDQFDVSHTKDDILWLGDEEEKVESGLEKYCHDYKEFAKQYRKSHDDSRRPTDIETTTAIDAFKKELVSDELADALEMIVVPPEDLVKKAKQTLTTSVTESQRVTFKAKISDFTVQLYILPDMSPNDPYLTIESGQPKEVIIIINQTHPHWSQLKGSEGVLNYLRHCTYDGIAEWQSLKKARTLDPDTIKLLKDKLLRIPLEIEKHDIGPNSGALAE